jgi:polyhydroxybutyrate depolymerase
MITAGSDQREYILHVPTGYDGASATPLVFVWHPLGVSESVTDAFMQSYTGMSDEADTGHFIAVYPKALPWGTNGSYQWNYSLLGTAPDDLAFYDAMLDHLESSLCIDTSRIFSTGYSDGGYMSVRLGCNRSDSIAAIAPVAGEFFPELPGDRGCPAQRAVPIAVFQGTGDPIVEYNGNGLEPSIPDGVMPAWAEHNGCSPSPTIDLTAPGINLHAYHGCTDGADTLLYEIFDADGDGPGTEGGGHQWVDPAYNLVGVGPATHQIDGNGTIWKFFSGHPMGGATTPSPTAASIKRGDLDCSGQVTSLDALLPIQFEMGLPLSPRADGCAPLDSGSPMLADIKCDGQIDALDSLALVQFASSSGISPPLPVDCPAIGS